MKDRILLIEPNNKTVLDLRNGLRVVMQGKRSSFIQIKRKYEK